MCKDPGEKFRGCVYLLEVPWGNRRPDGRTFKLPTSITAQTASLCFDRQCELFGPTRWIWERVDRFRLGLMSWLRLLPLMPIRINGVDGVGVAVGVGSLL